MFLHRILVSTFFVGVVVFGLAVFLSPVITNAQELPEICAKSGGEWVIGQSCKTNPMTGKQDCVQSQQCECPEGEELSPYGACVVPLMEGIPPETPSECTKVAGGNWNVVGKNRETGGSVYACQCPIGQYFSAANKNKCTEIPVEYLCEATAGTFTKNECICPPNKSFIKGQGCVGGVGENAGPPTFSGTNVDSESPDVREETTRNSNVWIISGIVVLAAIVGFFIVSRKQ